METHYRPTHATHANTPPPHPRQPRKHANHASMPLMPPTLEHLTRQFSFLIDALEIQGSYMYACSFEESDMDSSLEDSLSWVKLFSSSEEFCIGSEFDIFTMNLVLSSKIV